MVKYSLAARFPLGVYLGHTGDANRDLFPDPARLHAALLNAAAQGSTAVDNGEGLHLSEESTRALSWLEENPPSGLALPEVRWLSPRLDRMIYRNVASIVIDKKGTRPHLESRAISDGVAVKGSYAYIWEEMPTVVAEALDRLLVDVPALGEASSLVILERVDCEPTLLLDATATPFTAGRVQVRVPEKGRTNHLIASYRSAHPNKKPTKSADKFSHSDSIRKPALPTQCLTSVRYVPVNHEEPDTPWSEVLLLEASGRKIAPDEQVAACVALHRALIARIQSDVSPVVTGKYPGNAGLCPPNHMSIQYLPHKHVEHLGLNKSVFALLLPKGTDATTYQQLGKALSGEFPLWSRGQFLCNLEFNGRTEMADRFWKPSAPGSVRLWKPLNAFVPESRTHFDKKKWRKWGLRDAGLVSVAHVCRDTFNTELRGPKRYEKLRDLVESAGVQVFQPKQLTSHPRNFVHRTNKSLTVQPWTGLIYLGGVLPETAITALGQSRHLGGGLLVPVDVDKSEFDLLVKENLNDDQP